MRYNRTFQTPRGDIAIFPAISLPVALARNSQAADVQRIAAEMCENFALGFAFPPCCQGQSSLRDGGFERGRSRLYIPHGTFARGEPAMTDGDSERLAVHGIELEVVRRGSGRPILLLH